MSYVLVGVFLAFSAVCFLLFLRGPYQKSPLWLMLSAWGIAIGIPQLNLSKLERDWTLEFLVLVGVSLITFTFGFSFFNRFWPKFAFWKKFSIFRRDAISTQSLRIVVYLLLVISAVALY